MQAFQDSKGLIGKFKIGKGSGMVNIACSHRQSAFLALRETKAHHGDIGTIRNTCRDLDLTPY